MQSPSYPRIDGDRRRPPYFACAILALILGAAPAVVAQTWTLPPPPQTARDAAVDDYFGVKIRDPYRWLEDQWSPRTRAWINAQDRYTFSILDRLPGRKSLQSELTRLMKVGVTGMPIERHGRFFFMKRSAGQDLFSIFMKQGVDGNSQLLVNPEPMSKNHSVSVALLGASEDGTVLIYGVRQGGEDELTVHLLNVDTGRNVLTMPKARYDGLALTPDHRGLYYCSLKPNGPRAYYHAMGTEPSQDRIIFGDGLGPMNVLDTRLSDDGRYLLITASRGASGDNDQLYYEDLSAHGAIVPIVDDIHARFSAHWGGDALFVETNRNAPKGRVFAVDLSDPSPAGWKQIIPEGRDPIRSIAAAGGRIFVNYLHDATSRLSVFDPDGRHLADVPLPVLGTVGGINGRWKGKQAFFSFASFVFPPAIYRYNVENAEERIWAKENVPIESTRFEVQQVWYSSKDGTHVPMFLVYPKGLRFNGMNPTLMAAYGGFDISVTPWFWPEAAAWVENGGVFALPNLRGGGEFGEAWHRAGMLAKKQNVFDDFFSAAEWLIRHKYTNPDKLAITGTSNGGLLMGAAMTQRPGLYRAIVCRYPLLDILRYQRFFIAKLWVPEYGSSDNPKQFKYLLKYSPYQNVKKGVKYPAVLFVTGDGDTRVAPLHARKMTAMMQWATASHQPVMILYDTTSGHSGGRPLGTQIDELTNEMLFMSWQLGMRVP